MLKYQSGVEMTLEAPYDVYGSILGNTILN
jgi:hypothetical protein